MGGLAAPRVPDGAEDRPLIVPPGTADPAIVAPAKRSGNSIGDTPVHQNPFEAAMMPPAPP